MKSPDSLPPLSPQPVTRRAFDGTMLAAAKNEPPLLRTMLRLIRASRRPMALFWGTELIRYDNGPFLAAQLIASRELPATADGLSPTALSDDIHAGLRQVLQSKKPLHIPVSGIAAKYGAVWEASPIEDEFDVLGVLLIGDSEPAEDPTRASATELQQQLQDWTRLHTLSKDILRSSSAKQQFQQVLTAAAAFLGSAKGVISLHDASQNALITHTSIGLSAASLAAVACVAIGDGACGTAFAQRRQVIVEDTELDPLYEPYRPFARSEHIRAVISTPLYNVETQCIGVISVYLDTPRGLNERELRLTDICASYIPPLIEGERFKEELHQAENWSRQILDSIGEGFLVMDGEFRITQINVEGLKIVGCEDASQLIGTTHWAAWPGSEELASGKAFKRVLQEKVAIGLEQVYPLRGVDTWFDVHAYPTGDGVAVFFRDITEKVKADQALQDSRRRLHQLANTIPQLAWMADPDGHIHWYNDRWYDYTGKTFDEMTGWGWQSVHDPQVLPSVTVQWKHSIATGEEFTMTFPLLGADGKFRPFFTRVSPLRDAAGKITQWFGSNTDVSPLRDAEQAVRNSEERLNEGLAAGRMAVWEWDLETDRIEFSANAPGLFGESWKTASEVFRRIHPDDLPGLQEALEAAVPVNGEFRRVVRLLHPGNGLTLWVDFRGKVFANDTLFRSVRGICIDINERIQAEENLKQANKRKDEFLAMLAHELRNPLSPISTAAQLLRSSTMSEERVRHTSEIITRQVRHMTNLVDDLLDVSRVTRGLVTLNREPTDVKTVISSALEQVRPLVESRHHVLTVRTAAEPAYILGDKTRLVQVIANLLNNSAKYTPQGGEIQLRADVENALVKVEVSDNGMGIDAELLPNVFDLFAQGERTPDRSQGGLGLGLSLVKSLVELHGGQVQARSEGSGRGSTFALTFPRVVPPALAMDSGHPSAGTPDRPALRLMVVDDNRDAAQTLGEFLETYGHEVAVFNDAMTALQSLETQSFDAYVLDIGLPDLNGYELAKQIRIKVRHSGLLIALTGYGQEHDRVLSKAAGFGCHLVKPVDVDKLLNALNRATRAEPEPGQESRATA